MGGIQQTFGASAGTSSEAITRTDFHMRIKGTPGNEEALDPSRSRISYTVTATN
jgi:hypothetical protein